MAERKGQDFVWVRPAEGFGSVTVVAGNLVVRATREQPFRVTRGEWNAILKTERALETCPPPEIKTSSVPARRDTAAKEK